MTLKVAGKSHWKDVIAVFWTRENSVRRRFYQGGRNWELHFGHVDVETCLWHPCGGIDLTVGYAVLERRVKVWAVNRNLKVIIIYLVLKATILDKIVRVYTEAALNCECLCERCMGEGDQLAPLISAVVSLALKKTLRKSVQKELGFHPYIFSAYIYLNWGSGFPKDKSKPTQIQSGSIEMTDLS